MPALQFHKGVVGQIVDFTVPPIKASASRAHRGADTGIPRARDQGDTLGAATASASGVHPRGILGAKDQSEASASRAHSRVCGADSVIPRSTDHRENRGGVPGSDSEAHPRAHRPRSAVVNLAETLRRCCLKRRWHGREKRRMSSSRGAGKMRPSKSKRASRDNGGSLRHSCGTRACCEAALREEAGFRFGVLIVFEQLLFFFAQSDLPLLVPATGCRYQIFLTLASHQHSGKKALQKYLHREVREDIGNNSIERTWRRESRLTCVCI